MGRKVKGLTPREEVLDTLRRAAEKGLKAQRKVIAEVVKRYDHIVPHVIKCLQGAGLVETDGFTIIDMSGASELPKSILAASIAAQSKDRSEKAAAAKAARQEQGEDDAEVMPSKSIPGKYWTLATLGVETLQDIAAVCEPGILSKANTTSVLTRGKPEENKEELTKYIEIATGWPPSFSLIGELRNLKMLLAAAKEASDDRGRRAGSSSGGSSSGGSSSSSHSSSSSCSCSSSVVQRRT